MNDFFVRRKPINKNAELTYRTQTWKIREKSSFIQAMEMGVNAQNSNIAVTGTRVAGFVYFFESVMIGTRDYDKLMQQGYIEKSDNNLIMSLLILIEGCPVCLPLFCED